MKTQKDNRGGKRPGAGRKPKNGNTSKFVYGLTTPPIGDIRPRPQNECIDAEKILRLSRQHCKEINNNLTKLLGKLGESDTNRNNYLCKENTPMEDNNICSQLLNNLIIQNVFTAPLENIISKYTKLWFSTDGTFVGFDAVAGDIDKLTRELTDLLPKVKETFEKAKSVETETESFDIALKELANADYLQSEIALDELLSQFFDNRMELLKDGCENPDVRNGIIKGTATLHL